MAELNPLSMKDWEIAEAAEKKMKTVFQLAEELGVEKYELQPYGHYTGKLDYARILERTKENPRGKYVEVTAITPTHLGEGKSTTTIGLIQGLGKMGQRALGTIRQPSSGPTFNLKGSAAGGGLSQCIPLSSFSLGLTGDIDAVTNAHNLAMVALTSRMQHEFNYNDEVLQKKNLKRLNIDPRNTTMNWAIDFCAQALREIIIGLGGKNNGLMMKSGFQISVSSEIMAILAITTSLADFRKRMGQIVVAYSKDGRPVTTADLEVDGAMTALTLNALCPNLLQTLEGQPVLVHTGPFANISIGQSSIIADLVGMGLADYVVTESGFGADIGFEKFWNIKCRHSGLTPSCSVIVATIRALKMHGGGPQVKPGKPLDKVYTEPAPAYVEKGLENLMAHVEIVKKSGITPVVCINHFYTDTKEEVALVKRAAEAAGAKVAVSKHWEKGGEGALELVEAVVEACQEKSGASFTFLYPEDLPVKEKILRIATEIYGADGVTFTPESEEKLAQVAADQELSGFDVCMAKTHLSLSHDPAAKGRPQGWKLPVKDVLIYRGAGLVVPVTGEIKLMPGTASDPSYRKIDVDLTTRRVTGLF
ncbi:MAG TPA: formate--tetrahydrofolate ligase [Firmicutes bacterium]|jgi:formyltetrahydrofolate synthetase|nr:formate--tetrahydrofolate ligase [Bacillota bacterium]